MPQQNPSFSPTPGPFSQKKYSKSSEVFENFSSRIKTLTTETKRFRGYLQRVSNLFLHEGGAHFSGKMSPKLSQSAKFNPNRNLAYQKYMACKNFYFVILIQEIDRLYLEDVWLFIQ